MHRMDRMEGTVLPPLEILFILSIPVKCPEHRERSDMSETTMASGVAMTLGGRPVPTEPMTYEQFLKWVDEDDHCEWVEGRVVPMAAVDTRHDGVVGFLRAVVPYWLEVHAPGVLLGEPFQMKTGPDLPGRSPDLLYVAKERQALLGRKRLNGPADLVVEVISTDSVTRDRVTKFAEYEQSGVREYWLPDPNARRAEFFRLGADGRYELIPVDEHGVFRSEVLTGLWLKVDWLWEPRPPLIEILRYWGLV
jgi:Uma2 family endonuclease